MANGIIIIDKPSGWTSMDVCAKLRGILHTMKVGLAVTLDPMATGLLPLCFGNATKFSADLLNAEKGYEARVARGRAAGAGGRGGGAGEE